MTGRACLLGDGDVYMKFGRNRRDFFGNLTLKNSLDSGVITVEQIHGPHSTIFNLLVRTHNANCQVCPGLNYPGYQLTWPPNSACKLSPGALLEGQITN